MDEDGKEVANCAKGVEKVRILGKEKYLMLKW